MKVKELKVLSEPDLENKSLELKKEMMKMNSQIAVGAAPKNVGKIKGMRRTIARILTIKNQKIKGGRKKE